VTERILIDTGPIVALLDENDQHHQACAMQAQKMPEVVYTCWPVVSEACYLQRRRPDLVERLLETVHDGVYELPPVNPLRWRFASRLTMRSAAND